ncbi:hypothetical protein TNIN_317921 [Trichonephila inaurata madagascariensis]|uniref:Reverse transcriptase/retrotransposon-derived protein RNase H-like domain-containing protein n=1 Tax=Trichonephila inaurata madagascariensis TaxID=2747483 RepID=A0A8X6IDJ4_9ARAC|nr:hypothetical protein TNIN_317921 [Trichonephila inaurata madagascariensis]
MQPKHKHLLTSCLLIVKNDKRPVPWNEEAETAFMQCKSSLANVATLKYPTPDQQLCLLVDASNSAVGDSTKEPFPVQKSNHPVVLPPRLDQNVPIPATTRSGRKAIGLQGQTRADPHKIRCAALRH